MPPRDEDTPIPPTRPEPSDDERFNGRRGGGELPPPPMRDPRLEIPEILRTPIKKPELPNERKVVVIPPGSGGLGDLARALSVGLDFLFIIAAGGFLGWLFDWWRGTGNVGVLVGLGVGFLAGTARLLQRLNRDDKPGPKPGPGSPKR